MSKALVDGKFQAVIYDAISLSSITNKDSTCTLHLLDLELDLEPFDIAFAFASDFRYQDFQLAVDSALIQLQEDGTLTVRCMHVETVAAHASTTVNTESTVHFTISLGPTIQIVCNEIPRAVHGRWSGKYAVDGGGCGQHVCLREFHSRLILHGSGIQTLVSHVLLPMLKTR